MRKEKRKAPSAYDTLIQCYCTCEPDERCDFCVLLNRFALEVQEESGDLK